MSGTGGDASRSIEMQRMKRAASSPSSFERKREHAINIEGSSTSRSQGLPSRRSRIPPPGQNQQQLPLDPPLNGFPYYISYLFTRNYEPLRPFLRWLVVHREYLRLFWRGVAIPFLAYFWHMLMSGASVGAILVVYYLIGDSYITWARDMARRHDGARRVPAFLKNALHFLCGDVFAIGSMFFGQWFKANSIELHIFSSFAVFVLCMSMSRWTTEDFGLLDGIIAVVLSTIYVVFMGEYNLLYPLLLLASSLAALKYVLIPAGNAIIVWIGELGPQDQPICGNWFTPTFFMIVVAVCLLIPYVRYNIMETVQVGIPLNVTQCNSSTPTAPTSSPLSGN